MDVILAGLNHQQQCAVTSSAAVLQVLAPPGSGKTKTLTSRVAYLIAQRGLQPWNMIVCTFTVKAANEMRERLRNFVGQDLQSKLVLGTFHSIAFRYLRVYGHHIGIQKGFGVADDSDQLAILRRIIKRCRVQVEPSKARSWISRFKSKDGLRQGASAAFGNGKSRDLEMETLYEEYEASLAASNLLDYDDLLLRCLQLLRSHPECVQNIQAVLIDEFQDTNTVQYELMGRFAQHMPARDTPDVLPCITIVGDPDQSIYSFRHAEIENLNRMIRRYPSTQVVNLEINYRSSNSIIIAAQELIEQDDTRPQKKMIASACPVTKTANQGTLPVLRKLPHRTAEAIWIVAEIQRCMALCVDLFDYCDFAILLRSASLSRRIEAALSSSAIPYRMVGGHRFYERAEVKILVDYLRVICKPDHAEALARIVNVPSRRVPLKKLQDEAESRKQPLWALVVDVANERSKLPGFGSNVVQGLRSFTKVITTAREQLLSGKLDSLKDVIDLVMNKIGFEDYLKKMYKEEIDFTNRWGNVQELLSHASTIRLVDGEFEELEQGLHEIEQVEQAALPHGPVEVLSQFLSNVALNSNAERKEGQNSAQVTISTIHAAKGLEWPVVFIPSAYNGSIPHKLAEDNVQEERRLFYVGMTRAMGLLYVSWPEKNGHDEPSEFSGSIQISPFLSEFPTNPPFFAEHGPKLSFQRIKELAAILDRPCPRYPQIVKACRSITRLEDSPADDWKFREETSTMYRESAAAPPSKRTKTEECNPAQPFQSAAALLGTAQCTVAESPLSSNFMSASAQLKLLQKTEVPQNFSNPADNKSVNSKRQRMVASDQERITAFFSNGGISSAIPASVKTSTSAPIKKHLRSIGGITSSRIGLTQHEQSSFASITGGIGLLRSKENLHLPFHKVRTTALPKPSWLAASENDDGSSLRTSATSLGPKKNLETSGASAGGKELQTALFGAKQISSAPTLHLTSMQQVNARSIAATRHTLGTSRSHHGWAHDKKFKPPFKRST